MYEHIIADLRQAYDRSLEERTRKAVAPWKVEVRQHFLHLLQQEAKTTLLELGAGTGRDSLFFQEQGFEVSSQNFAPKGEGVT